MQFSKLIHFYHHKTTKSIIPYILDFEGKQKNYELKLFKEYQDVLEVFSNKNMLSFIDINGSILQNKNDLYLKTSLIEINGNYVSFHIEFDIFLLYLIINIAKNGIKEFLKIVTEKDYEQGLNTKTYVVPYTEYDTFYNSLEYNSDVKNGINALAGINTCTIVSDFKQTDVKINIDRINKILNNSKEYNFKDNMLIIN